MSTANKGEVGELMTKAALVKPTNPTVTVQHLVPFGSGFIISSLIACQLYE